MQSLLESMLGRARAIQSQSTGAKRSALVLSAVVLGAGLYLSIRANAGLGGRVDPIYFGWLLLVALPALIGLNATEFHLMGRLCGARIGARQAIETSVMAGAANMLPLPGGVITRTAVLRGLGVDIGTGALANLVFGGLWLALALAVSGFFLIRAGARALGGLFLAAGLCGALMLALLARRMGAGGGLLAGIVGTRLAAIMLESIRYYWALVGLGFLATLESGAVLSAASAMGSAVSLVPAGLGVREVASAALARAASIDPGGAFLAAALLRMVTLLGLLVLSGCFALLARRRSAS